MHNHRNGTKNLRNSLRKIRLSILLPTYVVITYIPTSYLPNYFLRFVELDELVVDITNEKKIEWKDTFGCVDNYKRIPSIIHIQHTTTQVTCNQTHQLV